MRVSLFLVSLLSFAPSSTLSSSVCSDRDEVAVQNMMPVSNGCSKPPGLSVDGEEVRGGEVRSDSGNKMKDG
jgi:hypothetical protein